MMKLKKREKEILEKVRKAVQYVSNGDPMSDAIEHSETVEAFKLLLKISQKTPNAAVLTKQGETK